MRRPFPDHFSAEAPAYLRSRPSYPDALVEWLVQLTDPRELAWDAGCGSGQLSIPLAKGFACVVASDASAAQVAAAPAHPGVHYRVARSEASGLPRGRVDLCVAAQAAHWFDLAAYFTEVKRVGRAGSAVALVSYGRPRLEGELNGVVQRFMADVLAPCWPRERRHVEAGYRSLRFPFDELPAPSFEMTHRWDLDRFAAYVKTWSAVANLERRDGPGPLQRFLRELAAAWGPALDRQAIHWPLSVRAGRWD